MNQSRTPCANEWHELYIDTNHVGQCNTSRIDGLGRDSFAYRYVMSPHINESSPLVIPHLISDLTYLLSYINGSYPISMSRVAYYCAMFHINESRHVTMRHIPHQWVMSYINAPCHTLMSYFRVIHTSALVEIWSSWRSHTWSLWFIHVILWLIHMSS